MWVLVPLMTVFTLAMAFRTLPLLPMPLKAFFRMVPRTVKSAFGAFMPVPGKVSIFPAAMLKPVAPMFTMAVVVPPLVGTEIPAVAETFPVVPLMLSATHDLFS